MSCKFLLHHFLLWRVPDYLMMIILAIIAAVIGAKVRPHCREFEWSDPSINHPFATKETFPMYSVIIAVVLVALVYFAGELCTRWKRSAGKLNMCLHVNGWIVTHAFSILLAFIFVNVSKLYAGRLRPDFIARLAREGITEANVATLTHAQLCHAARNGRLSFPSGHSGTSFAGFVPPCIYLMGLMRTLNGGRVWLATIALFPLILPIAVAISRTVDYRHNFDDILTGSLVGALCGIFAVLISFRVSLRGEWTLRDHPDDTGRTRVWLREMLAGDEPRHARGGAGDEDHSSETDAEDSDDSDLAEVEVSVPRNAAGVPPPQHKKYLSPGTTAEKKRAADGAFASSPLSSSTLVEKDYLSPSSQQARAPNPSPSTKHNSYCPTPAAEKKNGRGTSGGRHRSQHYQREREEKGEETSSVSLTPSGRRKSNGDPAVVERFYPQE